VLCRLSPSSISGAHAQSMRMAWTSLLTIMVRDKQNLVDRARFQVQIIGKKVFHIQTE